MVWSGTPPRHTNNSEHPVFNTSSAPYLNLPELSLNVPHPPACDLTSV